MALSPCNVLVDLHDQELTKHGDHSFPIGCYHDDLCKDLVPWHWHEEWEFAIIEDGNVEFLLENQIVKMKKGDCIFINGKALHAANNITPSKPAFLHSASFHPRLIGGNTDSIFWQKLVQPFLMNPSFRCIHLHPSIQWQKDVIDHFERVWQAVVNEYDDFENIVRYELSAAIRILIQNNDINEFKISEKDQTNAKRIRIMLEYIEEHYNEDITIQDLATLIHVSTSACLRCFHQTLHTTPMQYVKGLRIKKATDLLLSTNQSVKEIAFQCGFNDMSYFNRAFKDIYSVTPGEYRKNGR